MRGQTRPHVSKKQQDEDQEAGSVIKFHFKSLRNFLSLLFRQIQGFFANLSWVFQRALFSTVQ